MSLSFSLIAMWSSEYISLNSQGVIYSVHILYRKIMRETDGTRFEKSDW